MKLTRIKGITHDFVHYLDFNIWHGYFRDTKKDFIIDAIRSKSSFSKVCVAFYKERLPKNFDFSRVKNIIVEVHRTMTSLNITVVVKVDNLEFSYKGGSSWV
jgi:hypothetical protein